MRRKFGKLQARSREKSGGNFTRDVFFLCVWLIIVGLGGLFLGSKKALNTALSQCPKGGEASSSKASSDGMTNLREESPVPCIDDTRTFKGNTVQTTIPRFERVKTIATKGTKWKDIISIEPKYFVENFLFQYPDTLKLSRPPILFSHRAIDLENDKILDKCKVLDIALVSDSPDTCVSITETYHDVASYHMIHAEKQADGSYQSATNMVHEQFVPEFKHYESARDVLQIYYEYNDVMIAALRGPLTGALVGTFIQDIEHLHVFENSLASALKFGGQSANFVVFSFDQAVKAKCVTLGVHFKLLPNTVARAIAKLDFGGISKTLGSSAFVRLWLAFLVADSDLALAWQAPGNVWFAAPLKVLRGARPKTEAAWAYMGDSDPRASPFFLSTDFFWASAAPRTVHLLHELLLQFDLVLAWASVDAVVSYRTIENNARYGLLSWIYPTAHVLHAKLLESQPQLFHSVLRDRTLQVLVLSAEASVAEAKKFLTDLELWTRPPV
jgi:hypothetical protein